MDLNPDEAIAAGWLRDGAMVTHLLNWMSKKSLKRSDRVIALDRFMAERICDKGVAKERGDSHAAVVARGGRAF